MSNVIIQAQMLLSALSAVLSLIEGGERGRAGQLLEAAAEALSAAVAAARNIDDLAEKISAIRAEVEAMASAGRAASADELDAALTRVRRASAAFRAAAGSAGAGA